MEAGGAADLQRPPPITTTSINIMDHEGHNLIAIIQQQVEEKEEPASLPGLIAKFETINLKEDEQEEEEEDADFDEILHRERLDTPEWGEAAGRKYLEAPEYQQKVAFRSEQGLGILCQLILHEYLSPPRLNIYLYQVSSKLGYPQCRHRFWR